MKKVKLLLTILCAVIAFTSFHDGKEKVNWISFEEMQKQYAINPKPVLIDLYTSWCGWCKVMDKNTYSDSKVAAYINEKYYAVKYDAESKTTVVFNKKTFEYNRQYKTNDLAIHLTGGRLEYPTTVFLPQLDAQPAPLSGYLKPSEIEAPLRYFGDGAYKKQTFVDYNKSLKKSW